MLSFLFHFLLQSPASLQKVRQEVDRVCGAQPVPFEQLQKLEYVDAALKETLRLKSTAPAFGVTPKRGDETLGGKYRVPHGQDVMIVLDALHLDPKVWGDDAEVFKLVLSHRHTRLMANEIGPNECSTAVSQTYHPTAGSRLVAESGAV